MEIHAPIDLMHVSTLLEQFIAAKTPDEGRRILEQHSELLSDYVSFLLDWVLDDARAAGNAEAVFVIHERCGLLRRCREVGVAACFKELGR